jgi:hypothetical protein
MLAAVLRRAQPLVCHVGAGGQLQPQPVLLDVLPPAQTQQQQQQQLVQQQQQQQQEEAVSVEMGVNWPDVWQYAVVALRAVVLCRLGLDEDNVQVRVWGCVLLCNGWVVLGAWHVLSAAAAAAAWNCIVQRC